MNKLTLTKIGSVPVIIDEKTNTKTSFKGGYQDVVTYINRFKVADLVENIHHMPVFFFKQLDPPPINAPVMHEAHQVQFLPPNEGGLS
jgi:hypothetical protein